MYLPRWPRRQDEARASRPPLLPARHALVASSSAAQRRGVDLSSGGSSRFTRETSRGRRSGTSAPPSRRPKGPPALAARRRRRHVDSEMCSQRPRRRRQDAFSSFNRQVDHRAHIRRFTSSTAAPCASGEARFTSSTEAPRAPTALANIRQQCQSPARHPLPPGRCLLHGWRFFVEDSRRRCGRRASRTPVFARRTEATAALWERMTRGHGRRITSDCPTGWTCFQKPPIDYGG